nr:MAG TPA: hypothetical protein [Caudoviricetes sp.]
MTITEVLSRSDELRLNTISREQKATWVAELDGQIAERLDAAAPTYHWPEEEAELLLPSPYDRVYVLYLCSQIDYYNNETALYANDKAVYDAALSEALGWWRRGHCPPYTGNVKVM